jgi:sigma-B regulation protein RsbU (phosphoserine phosphatase)
MYALNKGVFENTNGEKYITLFIARFNVLSREMEYINAGHIPPLFYTENKISFLEEGGIMLGAFKELPELSLGKIYVPSNASLFCYTDGLLELENINGEQFGIENTCKSFAKNTDLEPQEIVENIFADAELYRGEKKYNDDLTLFACRF